MKLRSKVSDAAHEVKQTAERVGVSVQWNTLALIAVTLVASAALFIATSAMLRVVTTA